MELQIYSAGKIKSLPQQFCNNILDHNVKMFWIGDTEVQDPLASPTARGSMNAYIDIGAKVRIKPGNLYILPSFSCKDIISDENRLIEIYFLYLDLYPSLRGEMFEINIRKSSRCYALLSAITTLIGESKDILTPMVNSLFACPEISETLSFSSNTNISKVIKYIRYNYNRQMSNADLAAIAGYSTNYFIKAFREETGDSPYGYIQNVRLINAMNMLRNGSTPKQAAMACGYSDQNVFYRAFKKHFSKSPSFFYRGRAQRSDP